MLGLALVLAMLLAGWLAWQGAGVMDRLKGRSIAGWTIESGQFASLRPGRLLFDRLQLSRDGQGGSRIELDLQGVQLDFSLSLRQIDLLQVRQARVLWRAGTSNEPMPWPRLLASPLPLTELRIERLLASVELGQGSRWQIETPLHWLQQSDGRLQLQAELGRRPLQLLLIPGPTVKAELHWADKSDPLSVIDLYVTYAVSNSKSSAEIEKGDIHLQGKVPLKLAKKFSQSLQPKIEVPNVDGLLDLEVSLDLGPYLGQWTSLDAQLHAQHVQLAWGAATHPTRMELNGPVLMQLRPDEQGVHWSTTLQPALQWKIGAGSKPDWTVVATLSKAWRIAPGPQTYTASLPFELHLKGKKPLALRLDHLQLELAPDASLRSAKGQLHLAATRLHADWPAAALDTQWQLRDQKIAFTGQLSLHGQPLLQLAGDYGLNSSCGQVRLDYAGSLVTLDRMLQPRPKSFAPLQIKAGEGSGWLAGQHCLRPSARASHPVVSGQWQMKQAEITWHKALAKGLDLDLTLKGITPVMGSLALKLQTVSLAAGLALSPVQVALDWTASHLQLHRFDTGLLDGKLSASELELELAATPKQISWQIPLDVSHIDLERLLILLDVPGLSGSGRLSGQLPLAWTPAGVEIRNGQLSSQGAGQLRYESTVPVTDNPGLQALRDFRYSQLALDLDYQADGHYALDLKLDGHNPEFYSGHPIAFKLKLGGALPGLFKGALLSGDFDAYLLKQLQQGKQE